jgi:hypothetical protein
MNNEATKMALIRKEKPEMHPYPGAMVTTITLLAPLFIGIEEAMDCQGKETFLRASAPGTGPTGLSHY